MGQDLFGKQVLNTYDAIIKVGDNDTLTGIAKQLSDGRGNDAPIWLSTARMGIGITPDTNYTLTVNGAAKIGSLDVTGAVTAASVQLTGGSGSQGLMTWNTDEETVDIVQNGATLQVGQEVQVHVKNQTGALIPDGTPVYVTGTLGSSGRLTVAPMIADGTIEAKYFLGITTEDIGDGEDGKVTTFGKIRGLNTSAYSEGTTLYVSASTAGAFQTTAPVAPNLDLEVAIVINSHVNNGTIFVRATNGQYLGLLHDVYLNSPANNQFLVYNSTTSRWENQGIASVGSINLQSVTDNGNLTTNGIVLRGSAVANNELLRFGAGGASGSNTSLSIFKTADTSGDFVFMGYHAGVGSTTGSPKFIFGHYASTPSDGAVFTIDTKDDIVNVPTGSIQIGGTTVIDSSRNISANDITAANMTLSGYLRGGQTFVIDPSAHGDNTGTVQILGNLIVEGETTTINSTTVTIDDKNLVLASGAADANAANGAGITIDGASATMTYASATDRFQFNKSQYVTGTITASSAIFANSYFRSSDNVAVLSTDTAGTVYLRPNAWDSTTGQLSVSSSGAVNTAGGITAQGRLTATEVVTTAGEVETPRRKRFYVNISGGSGATRWYKIANVNQGNSGISIRGAFNNHVESFGTQRVDLTIFSRENDSNSQIEVTGRFEVAKENVGIRIVAGATTPNGVYTTYDVYVKTTQYSQIELDVYIEGNTENVTWYGSSTYVSTQPTGTVEFDNTATTQGSYVVEASQIKEVATEDWATSEFVNVTGDTMTGNLKFNDSVKAQFGSDNDFVVQHNGTHAYLDNNTGSIFIRTYADDSDIVLGSDDGSGGLDDYLRIDGSEGSVILYHYGDQKLITTSTGVSVTGALSGNISTSSISGGTIDINGTTAINLQYNGSTQLRVDSSGVAYLGTVTFANDGISLTDEDSTIDSFFHANVDYDAGLYTVTSNARYGSDYIQVDGLDSRDYVKFTISPKDIGDPDPHAYLYIGGDNSITAPNTLVDWHTIEMNALSVQINGNEVATQSWSNSAFVNASGDTMTGNLTLQYEYPRINLIDTNNDDDWSIINGNGVFTIYNQTDDKRPIQINGSNNLFFNANATNGINFVDGGSYTEMEADVVLRIRQRTEIWGSANGYYLDVRNSAGIAQVRLEGNGNESYFLNHLGIGTSSPEVGLHYHGSVDGEHLMLISNTKTYGTGTGTNETAALAFGIKESSTTVLDRLFAKIIASTRSEVSSSNGKLDFQVRKDGALQTVMTALSNGNIGIGQETPLTALDINRSGSNTVKINSTTSQSSVDFITNGRYYRLVAQPTGNGSRLDVYDQSGSQYMLSIDAPNSRVGILNSTPSYTLDVDGTIRAESSIRVSGNNVSDITESNNPTATSVNIGTYINSYGYIDISSSNANGGWLDFSKADGTDYAGRIRYWNSAERMAFYASASGTETLSIKNGEVGINATTPATTLHVNSTSGSASSVYTSLIVQSNPSTTTLEGGGTGIILRGVSSGGNIQDYDHARIRSVGYNTNNQHGLAFDTKPNAATGLTERMVITPSGYVSVGVGLYPSHQLHVGGAGGFTSNSSARALYLYQNANNAGNIIQFLDHNGSNVWELVGRNNQFYIYNNALSDYSFYIDPNDNNIGIGTTDAQKDLTLNGEFLIGATGHSKLHFDTSTLFAGIGFNRDVSNGNIFNSNSRAYQLHLQDNGLEVEAYTGAGANDGTPFRIHSNGCVGIGETSPASKLTVATGSAGDGALRLGVTNQEQFVFETGISGVTNGALVLKDVSTPYTYATFRNGNTGINTTDPQANLQVNGNTYINTTVSYFSEKLVVGGITRTVGLHVAGGVGFSNYANITHDDQRLILATERVSGAGHIALMPYGRVGVGTLDPSVYGTGMEIKTGTQSGLRLTSTTSGGGSIEIGADSGQGYIQNIVVGDYTRFYVSNAGVADTLSVSLRSNGNVGILNSSPNHALDVSGNINATNAYKLNGTNVIFVSATYTQLYNPEGAVCLYLGDSADRSNYYDNNYHYFRTAGGTSNLGVWNSTGLGIGATSFSEKLYVSGTARITSTLSVGSDINSSGIIQDAYKKRFTLNLSNDVDRWWKIATVNQGNSGISIKGALNNHVESFGTQRIDLTIYGREANNGANIEVVGNFDVATSGVGVRIVKLNDGTYDHYDVYIKSTRYTQCDLEVTIEGILSYVDWYGSTSNTTTQPSGLGVEFDSTTQGEGHYIVSDSIIVSKIADTDSHINSKLAVNTTTHDANASLTVQGSGYFNSDNDGQSRVLRLDAGNGNGNIIQFLRNGTGKWEVVGREGTFYVYKNDGTGSGMKWQIDTNGAHTITGTTTINGFTTVSGNYLAVGQYGAPHYTQSGMAYQVIRASGSGSERAMLELHSGNQGTKGIFQAVGVNNTVYFGSLTTSNASFGNNQEAFYFNTSGNVGLGNTTCQDKLHITGGLYVENGSGSGVIRGGANDAYHGMTFRGYPNSQTTTAMTAADVMSFWEYGGDFRWYLKSASSFSMIGRLNNGTLTVSGDIIAYGSPSDISLKENIKPIEGALDKVKKLQGVTFDWKEQDDQILDIKEDYGFIAQDVQEVVPELVRMNDNGKLSLRDKGIISILVEAVKEQQKQIDELKARLDGSTD